MFDCPARDEMAGSQCCAARELEDFYDPKTLCVWGNQRQAANFGVERTPLPVSSFSGESSGLTFHAVHENFPRARNAAYAGALKALLRPELVCAWRGYSDRCFFGHGDATKGVDTQKPRSKNCRPGLVAAASYPIHQTLPVWFRKLTGSRNSNRPAMNLTHGTFGSARPNVGGKQGLQS